MTDIHGGTEPGWGHVADAFRLNFDEENEIGAACCVYADGRPVVDIWGGIADRRSGKPWDKNTIVPVRSTTKGATAICAHILVGRGDLDLDAPVVMYWPEFGAEGKENVLVRWLLTHQAGLPAVDVPLTFQEACAWTPVIRALEAQKPFWPPGTQHAYHAWTFGFLVGEVVRRITDKTLGTFFADEVVGPLGLSSWIGLPEHAESRLAHPEVINPPAEPDPCSFEGRVISLSGAFPDPWVALDTRAARAAEFPSSNLVTDAHSLARMYAAAIGEVAGIRLLKPETVAMVGVAQTPASTEYGSTDPAPLPWSLGFMRMPMLGPRSFGHLGRGGSLGFADPEAGIGFGYVMNLMAWEQAESRVTRLVESTAECISRVGSQLGPGQAPSKHDGQS